MTPSPSPWPVSDFLAFMVLLIIAGVLFIASIRFFADLFILARGFWRAWREDAE